MKKTFILIFILLVYVCIGSAQVYAPTYFSKADFESDLRYLAETASDVHPKFLDAGFYNQWKPCVDTALADLPDSISFNDTFIRMVPVLRSIHDGHTGFMFPSFERSKYLDSGGKTMPLSVQFKNNKLFIAEYFGDPVNYSIEGNEILSINSLPASQIVQKMRDLDSDRGIELNFNSYFWMLWGDQPDWQLKINFKDSVGFILTSAVSKTEFYEQKNKYYPSRQQEKYQLTFPDYSFAFLKIGMFADDLAPFLKYAFDTIAQRKCENLIIDVRGNPGGNSRSVDSLLNYLTKESYTQYASITLRVSNEIKNYYRQKKPDIYQLIEDLPTDTLFCFDLKPVKPVYKPNFFEGNIFVLTDKRSYSAAATFAGVVKELGLGKIVGQSTGGTIHYYADYLPFKLPHTGIEFFVSSKEFIQHGGNDSFVEGVRPDFYLDNGNSGNLFQMVKYLRDIKSAEKSKGN